MQQSLYLGGILQQSRYSNICVGVVCLWLLARHWPRLLPALGYVWLNGSSEGRRGGKRLPHRAQTLPELQLGLVGQSLSTGETVHRATVPIHTPGTSRWTAHRQKDHEAHEQNKQTHDDDDDGWEEMVKTQRWRCWRNRKWEIRQGQIEGNIHVVSRPVEMQNRKS